MEQDREEEEVSGRKDDRALPSDQASGLSCVSLKSDHSKGTPPLFSPEPGPDSQSQSGVSHVSLKSDQSKGCPISFSPDPGPASQNTLTCFYRVQDPKDLSAQTLKATFTRLEEDILAFVKEQLKSFHRLLSSEPPEKSSERGSEREERSRGAVLNITLDFLSSMDQEPLVARLRNRFCSRELKTHLQQRYSQVFEGVAKAGSPTPLRQIYTELYITEGGASEVNQEHEVRYIETASRKPTERTITCDEMFKQQPIRARGVESEQPIRARAVESEQPIRARGVESEQLIRVKGVESEQPIRAKGVESEQPIRARAVESEQPIRARGVESEQPIRARAVESEQPIRAKGVESEQPIRARAVESEQPIRARGVESEQLIRVKGVESEQPIRARGVESEQPIRARGVESEQPIRAKGVESEQPIRAKGVESEQPIRAKGVESEQPIRTVLTKGVAGVGKTWLTQKFCLDWAEDKAHQDVQVLLPFTFRELNVLKDRRFSLVQLVHHFFSQTKGLHSFNDLQLLFILDGLDECRLPLDFTKTKALTEPTESASVEELLVNLIRGSLLPSARLWITTRPAAANQIRAECVSMVTEVRGFTDLQKEQYFRKRFTDEAKSIISHIKRVRSLFIMSYIPIFCWILSTVLEHVLKDSYRPELPKTLTQMYAQFLVVQAKVKNIKYHEGTGADPHWTPETREMMRSLGKLAFEQLQKGNLIFYESDLRECGLDAAEIARYSGVFTQVFREEPGLYQDKVYCFIHLSVQEFLAALHVHQTFFSSEENLLSPPRSSESSGSTTATATVQSSKKSKFNKRKHQQALVKDREVFYRSAGDRLALDRSAEERPSIRQHEAFYNPFEDREAFYRSFRPREAFYRSAVDRALQSPNGHLDLFLRFLLGLSLENNQRLLKGLLTPTESDLTNQETVNYIKQKLDNVSQSAERRLNLLYCLNELNDRSLVKQVQKVMREGGLSGREMSPAQWSAMSYILLSSNSDLEHFDLRKFCPTEKGLLGLLPVIKASTKATLSCCGLSPLCCGPLASVLSSSSLTHLDLSNNDLQDSGIQLLCEGLQSALCRLETLRLSGCLISERSGASLASVLSSSSLTHLDLSQNDLQDSGVKLLCKGLKSAPCRLKTLRLSGCLVSERGGASVASALSSSKNLRELDLSYNHPGHSAKLLRTLWEQLGRPLDSLRLKPAGVRWMTPGLQKYYSALTLDENTVNECLQLSDDGRTVTSVGVKHPDQLEWPQVLSSSALRSPCYYEVQWSGGFVDIAVSHRGIRRRGERSECEFGSDYQSWCLRASADGFSVRSNSEETALFPSVSSNPSQSLSTQQSQPSPQIFSSGRVGVFLDADSLSFFDVSSGSRVRLYTFNTVFMETVYAGFWLWNTDSSVTLVDMTHRLLTE